VLSDYPGFAPREPVVRRTCREYLEVAYFTGIVKEATIIMKESEKISIPPLIE
jgi:hypothetical protein